MPTKSTEMMNLPKNQQLSLGDALEIVPYFDESSKIPLTILIEAWKEAKEIVPNAEGNLVKLLRSKLTDEARCIIENHYNNFKLISWVWNFCHWLHYRRITSRVSDKVHCRQVSS